VKDPVSVHEMKEHLTKIDFIQFYTIRLGLLFEMLCTIWPAARHSHHPANYIK